MTTLFDIYAARYVAECSPPATILTDDLDIVLESTGEPAAGPAYEAMLAQAREAELKLQNDFAKELASLYLPGFSQALQARVFSHAATDLYNSISDFDSLSEDESEWWDRLASSYESLSALVLDGFQEGFQAK